MGLYTKIEKQLDNYYEIVFTNKGLTKQHSYLKAIVLLFLTFIIFMIIKHFI